MFESFRKTFDPERKEKDYTFSIVSLVARKTKRHSFSSIFFYELELKGIERDRERERKRERERERKRERERERKS